MNNRIAVFTNGFSNEFIEYVVSGLHKKAKIDGIDIFVFASYIVYFRYIPSMKAASPTILGLSFFLAYLALCLFPVVVEISEAVRWKHIS